MRSTISHVQVPVHKSEGDLAQLGETFNKMTAELRTQRDELGDLLLQVVYHARMSSSSGSTSDSG